MKRGIVTGAFDLLHAGHMNFIHEASKRCDELIVALHVNPQLQRENKNKPIESIVERQIKLAKTVGVKEVWCYETEEDLLLLFQYLKPDVRFLGSDYQNSGNTIKFPEIIPIEYIESLFIHTSDIRERIKIS